jgi:hypothetical protein
MRFWLCGPPVLNGLVFITAVALCGVTNAKADQLPKFSQFPAREYNRGPIGRVDLSHPHALWLRGAGRGVNVEMREVEPSAEMIAVTAGRAKTYLEEVTST